MQSSLLRFVSRRQREELSKRKHPSHEDVESGLKPPCEKKHKFEGTLKLEKLRQFSWSGRDVASSQVQSTAALAAGDVHPGTSRQSLQHILHKTHSLTDVNVPESSCTPAASSSSSPAAQDTAVILQSDNLPRDACVRYTPLEQQFLAIKAKYPDTLLFVECGYKYRFFGEDAEIASKVLHIGCFPDHNFKTGSIPVHRLNVHIRRLVAAGYKVGVVKQMETAALKATSEKKSGPFTRELTALYTRTTLIGPDVQSQAPSHLVSRGVAMETEEQELYLLCLCEQPLTGGSSRKKKGKEIFIGFFAVQPSAGNMIYDEFQDSIESFAELETRLSHLQPAEILYPKKASKNLINMLSEWKKCSGIEGLRYEQLPDEWFEYNNAFPTVTDFYGSSTSSASLTKTSAEPSFDLDTGKMAEAFQIAINLPSTSLCCLGALIHHLKPFKLQKVLSLTSNLQPFSSGSHCMRLNSRTLENLEIFKNQTTKMEKGSLFGVLNHACTPFGRRKLIKWISYPLRDIRRIKQRQEAVAELTTNDSPSVSLLRESILHLPDLERMLCSAYHKKCSPSEFYSLVKSLSNIHDDLKAFSEMAEHDISSELLLRALKEVPSLLGCVRSFLDALKEKSARDGDYDNLFTDLTQFPEVLKEKQAISELKQKLLDYRKQIRRTLSYYSLDYVTVSGAQYLVEVKNKDVSRVPRDWLRVSSTKQVSRFHPPYVLEAMKLLAQHSDQLRINAKSAWNTFLTDFSEHYGSCKRAIEHLATVDCLFSLAKVAKMPGYVCPEVVEEQVIQIRGGRHPVIDLLLGEGQQYVPNDTSMSSSGLRTMVITGPNMGGKSCYIKQVALLCIMAQIGSFVPASSARLGVLDAVYTRMGASDNIHRGKSTFMVELMEAAEIMSLSTSNCLVVLDELGRGTSTHDGTAIAYSTLVHFIEQIKCFVLFVTHYPLLGELERKYPLTVANYHMAYVEVEDSSDDYDKVVFLYQLERGQAKGSYGLHVAALAGVPTSILKLAQSKSKQLHGMMIGQILINVTNASDFMNILSKNCF